MIERTYPGVDTQKPGPDSGTEVPAGDTD